VGVLFLNRDASSEERAALSEALYHTLKDLLSCCARGATAITTNPNRFFEAVSPLSFIYLTTLRSDIGQDSPCTYNFSSRKLPASN